MILALLLDSFPMISHRRVMYIIVMCTKVHYFLNFCKTKQYFAYIGIKNAIQEPSNLQMGQLKK